MVHFSWICFIRTWFGFLITSGAVIITCVHVETTPLTFLREWENNKKGLECLIQKLPSASLIFHSYRKGLSVQLSFRLSILLTLFDWTSLWLTLSVNTLILAPLNVPLFLVFQKATCFFKCHAQWQLTSLKLLNWSHSGRYNQDWPVLGWRPKPLMLILLQKCK